MFIIIEIYEKEKSNRIIIKKIREEYRMAKIKITVLKKIDPKKYTKIPL